MVLTVKDYKIAYDIEANYAGGNAGIEYAQTPFGAGDVALLTAGSYPVDSIKVGKYVYEREQMNGIGVAAETKVNFTKGVEYGEFTITQYVQNAIWITAAIANETAGTIGTSYVFHVEKMGKLGVLAYFDICGCNMKEYKLDVTNKEYPKETITFMYYSIVESVAVTNLPSVLSTQPKIPKDFSVNIDAAGPYTDAKTIGITITNELLDEPAMGAYTRVKSVLISRDAEITMDYLTDVGSIYGDTIIEAADITHSVVVAGWGSALTVTAMVVTEENIEDMPDTKAVDEMSSTLKLGGTSTLTVA